MTRPAYYNEKDEKAAAWLRELIAAGVIAPGFVDTRSIEDVLPSDLDGFAQCHFFAGIGVWSYALRRAGWPDDRPVWTGSCPCQPFSAAGKGAGIADERHLWPAMFHLITQRRPPVFLGEQVASKDGLGWFDTVHADLEGADYACRGVDICAAGVGAPHIRQRLWFVGREGGLADAGGGRVWRRPEHGSDAGAPSVAGREVREQRVWTDAGADGFVGRLAQPEEQRRRTGDDADHARQSPLDRIDAVNSGSPGQLGHTERARREGGQPAHVPGTGWGCEGGLAVESGGVVVGGLALAEHGGCAGRGAPGGGAGSVVSSGGPGATNGPWRDADWIYCRDDKYRPVEPGTFPLAHESPARMVRLRGYGNAIVAEVAVAWIEACVAEGFTE